MHVFSSAPLAEKSSLPSVRAASRGSSATGKALLGGSELSLLWSLKQKKKKRINDMFKCVHLVFTPSLMLWSLT